MKLKNILYRNYNSLTNDEKEFYSENQEKYNLGICDKYNTIEIRLIYIEYDFEFLSERGLKEQYIELYDLEIKDHEITNIEEYTLEATE